MQLHEILRASKLARTTVIPLARRKALLSLISEIRCRFVRVVKGKKRLVSRLSEITIIPEVGDSYVVQTGSRRTSRS